jgi:hypothetical protein
VLEAMAATRVVSTVDALDAMTVPPDAIVLRIAPDEAVVIDANPSDIDVADDDAIVTGDTSWCGMWTDAATCDRLLATGADWRPPPRRPTLAQGMMFQLPVKVWLAEERVLVVVPRVVAADLAIRIGDVT